MARRCSRPGGSLSLQVELPGRVDTLPLYPGALRISFAFPWPPERINTLQTLGRMVAEGG